MTQESPSPAGAPAVLAVVRDPHDAHRALRARAEALGIPRARIDELAGIASGVSAHLLADPPSKAIGGLWFFSLVRALGMVCLLVEDTRRAERLREEPRRKGPWGAGKWRNARARALIQDLGRQGALLVNARRTPEERREFHRAGAKARWRKWRRERRLAREASGG